MEITQRVEGDVAVLVVTGPLSIEWSPLLKQPVADLVEAGALKLVIDLDQVPWVDSTGLGALVRTYVTFQRKGGGAKLCRPGKRVREILRITKLLDVIETYDTVEEALQSFAQPAREVTAGRR